MLEHTASSCIGFLWKVGEGPLASLWCSRFLGPQFKEDLGGMAHIGFCLFLVGVKAQDSGLLTQPAFVPCPHSYSPEWVSIQEDQDQLWHTGNELFLQPWLPHQDLSLYETNTSIV